MLDSFFCSLKRKKSHLVFNPWFDVDSVNDTDQTAPQKRLDNLKAYMGERLDAKYLLVAEALGYQGGHFTGIPMTSERIILGHMVAKGIFPTHVCNLPLERTSRINIQKDGFNEPTATIVWGKLIADELDTRDFIFWNAFPWHPFKDPNKILSNRTPNKTEMSEGAVPLRALIQAIKFEKIIALGNKAGDLLQGIGIDTAKVRHPAYGGANQFREQIINALDS